MTESELKRIYEGSTLWKRYCAKKGAVTRLAKRSDHMWAQCQYTDYSDPPGVETWGIVELPCSDVLNHGIWEAVQAALVKAGKIAKDSVEFCFTRVCGFDESSHCVSDIEF